MISMAFPVALDATADGVVCAVHEVETIDRVGLQLNLFIAWLQGAYSAKVFVFPEDEVAEEHHVVAGVHRWVGGVAVPELPDGGGTVVYHIAPARIGVVGGNLQCEVTATVFGERAHQKLNAYNTCRDMTVVQVFGAVDDVFEDIVFMTFGHHPEKQRQDVGCHGVVVVTPDLMVQILRIICLRRG